MGKMNQFLGDCLKKVNPQLAQEIVISRRIRRECGNKKIIICSSDTFAACVDKRLCKDGRGCEYFADLEGSDRKINGKEVKPIESVMYEDTADIYLVILASQNMHRLLGKLIEWGFTGEQYHIFCLENIPGGSKLLDIYDVNLGFTRKDDLMGFTLFDSGIAAEDDAKTLVTLGGSTTDATFANVMSWSEFMQHKLCEQGVKTRVLCGGIAAANSTQELIKLIRDVLPMQPNAVLVYSGINDIKMRRSQTPFVLDYQEELAGQCIAKEMVVNGKAYRNVGTDSKLVLHEMTCGLANHKPYAQYWIDNMRMMHALCAEFDIPFHAFLQPNAYVSDGDISFHKELLDAPQAQEYRQMTLAMAEGIRELPYITDLTKALDGQAKWYMDDCHILEPGNNLIAEKIVPVAKRLLER